MSGENDKICLVGSSERALRKFADELQSTLNENNTQSMTTKNEFVVRLVKPFTKTNVDDCRSCILVADGDQSRLLISNTVR